MLALLATRGREIEAARSALYRDHADNEAFEDLGFEQAVLTYAIEVTEAHPFLTVEERIERLPKHYQEPVSRLVMRARLGR